MASKIEELCGKMVADANAQFAKYEKESKSANTMRLFLSDYSKSKQRTPEEQAKEVLAGKSWTCNSSHMADAARHVGLKLNGKVTYDLKKFQKDSREDYDEFVEVYGSAMARQGLRNYRGGANFDPLGSDAYHMELKDSRLAPDSEPVQKCLQYYAKATREDGQKKNAKFEQDASVKKFLDNYEKSK
jgi:hypothetical protein